MNHGIVFCAGNQVSTFNRNLARPNYMAPMTTSFTFHPCSLGSRLVVSSKTTGPLRAVYVVQSSTAGTFYDLLGVPKTGAMSEIKQAYKKLARKYHPDVSPADFVEENTKKFIELREAYEALSDPNRRASYDRHLGSGLHLAFSSKNQLRDKQVWDVMGGWRNQWQSQLTELKRKSMRKELRRETSWAARMRKQNGPGMDSTRQVFVPKFGD